VIAFKPASMQRTNNIRRLVDEIQNGNLGLHSPNGCSLSQEKQFCRNLRLRLKEPPGIQQVS
jgi:hypothetical protein